MSKLYFICRRYAPSTAVFQRDYAIARGIAEHGVDVTCIYIMPGERPEILEEGGVNHLFIGDKNKRYGKILGFLISFFQTLGIIKNNKFVLSCIIIPLMLILQWFKGCNMYVECNEYPPFMQMKKRGGKLLLNIYLYVCRKCAGVFTISKSLKDYLISQGVRDSRVIIVNMVVDSKRFENIEKDMDVEPYVAYCGTISNFKDGVDVLLKSFAEVAQNVADIKLYLLGETPNDSDRNKNMSIITEHNMGGRVYMPGKISGNEMPKYLVNAQVLVLARPNNIQTQYGFPTKLGEYLLTGNPVLLTNVGEMKNYLDDGVSCVFAKPDDYVDFAKKLLWILEHPLEGRQIGAQGRKVAITNFNYFTEAGKLFRLIYGEQ